MSAEFTRTPPHDLTSEKAVLGAMIGSLTSCSKALALLVHTDFYVPAHGLIFETIAELFEERSPTDPAAVHNRLLRTGRLVRIPGGSPYLIELMRSGEAVSVEYHAREVADLSLTRAVAALAMSMTQRAFSADGTSGQDLLAWATQALVDVAVGTGVERDEDDRIRAKDWLDEPPPRRWVVPGLLERRDRLILTGDEGGGKSTLIRQLAVCAAAGLAPFAPEGPRTTPAMVMVVDCENSNDLSHRRYHPLIKIAEEITGPLDDRLNIYLRPKGLDLTRRADTAWLRRRIEDIRPDLICIGPIYRLHRGDPNEESDARRVSVALDSLREVCDSALVVEGHAPHGQAVGKQVRALRPVGSSLWMRWPEMGLGMHLDRTDPNFWMFRTTALTPWRGSRDDNRWPKRIRASRMGVDSSTKWPWIDDDAPSR